MIFVEDGLRLVDRKKVNAIRMIVRVKQVGFREMRSVLAVMAGRVAGVALALALGGLATPAFADLTYIAYYDQGQRAEFKVPVTATVGGRCGFNAAGVPSGVWDAGAIDLPGWSHQFNFMLECTGLSKVAVTSANGGLKIASAPTAPGFTGIAPYNVRLNVLHNSGTVVSSCLAGTLAASGSGCAFKGDATLGQGIQIPSASYNLGNSFLEVSYAAPVTSNLLAAGDYTDTLTITVSPAT